MAMANELRQNFSFRFFLNKSNFRSIRNTNKQTRNMTRKKFPKKNNNHNSEGTKHTHTHSLRQSSVFVRKLHMKFVWTPNNKFIIKMSIFPIYYTFLVSSKVEIVVFFCSLISTQLLHLFFFRF